MYVVIISAHALFISGKSSSDVKQVKKSILEHSNCTGIAMATAKNVTALLHGSCQNGTTAIDFVQAARQGPGIKVSTRVAAIVLKAVKQSKSSPFVDGFSHLRSYLELFSELNPGSVIDLCTSTSCDEGITSENFDSLFIMSGSQARCASLCKPVCGLDGAHFKTKLWNGYIFIVACTKDGNNRDLLVALFICNVENTENMANILRGMKNDEGVKSWLAEPNFVFAVDRAQCIKAAIYRECLLALVRDCGKHAQRNCGVSAKDAKYFWQYVCAKTLSTQTEAMANLKESDPIAANKLASIPKTLLCNLNFPGEFSWNEVTNNMSERGVKNVGADLRKEPPVAMLKGLFAKIITRQEKNRIDDANYVEAHPTAILCKYAKELFDVSNYLNSPHYSSFKSCVLYFINRSTWQEFISTLFWSAIASAMFKRITLLLPHLSPIRIMEILIKCC